MLASNNAEVVACGASAARIWGLAVPHRRHNAEQDAEVAFPTGASGRRGKRLTAFAHRWNLPEHHIVSGPLGQPVTDAFRTALDLARGLSLPFALVALDSALRWGTEQGMTPQEAATSLAQHWEDMRTSRGLRAVGRALPHADHRAESPLESVVRGRIIEARLPTPYLQVPVQGASGRNYRADLGLDLLGEAKGSSRLLIEADGMTKYSTAADLAGEKHRQHDLERRGFVFVRVIYGEAVDDPGPFIATIRRLIGPSPQLVTYNRE